MEALVRATPEALRFEAGKRSAAAEYPEFRAWQALLEPLFGITPPEWKRKAEPQPGLFSDEETDEDYEAEENEDEEKEEEEN